VQVGCEKRKLFVRETYVGSHIVLETEDPHHQRLVVPAHRKLRIGTLSAILRQVTQHKNVSREDILKGL